LSKKGVKGMFGMDLVIDDRNEVWPVECNARYTGAFPVYSMMQDQYQETNFDVFHLLEFLGLEYDFNLDKLQQLYRQPKKAAHLIIHNQERKWVKVEGDLRAGVYKYASSIQHLATRIKWQRPGFCLQDLKSDDEFCLCDRAAIKGRILKPGERLVRLLFRKKIAVY